MPLSHYAKPISILKTSIFNTDEKTDWNKYPFQSFRKAVLYAADKRPFDQETDLIVDIPETSTLGSHTFMQLSSSLIPFRFPVATCHHHRITFHGRSLRILLDLFLKIKDKDLLNDLDNISFKIHHLVHNSFTYPILLQSSKDSFSLSLEGKKILTEKKDAKTLPEGMLNK